MLTKIVVPIQQLRFFWTSLDPMEDLHGAKGSARKRWVNLGFNLNVQNAVNATEVAS
jgi:hypothetical protein